MKLLIYTKHHYGNDYLYLENRKKRMAFKRLTSRKTITETDLRDLEKVLDVRIEFELVPYIRQTKRH